MKTVVVIGPMFILLLGLAGFAIAHPGSISAPNGEQAAALVLSALCFGTAVWALQWVAVAFTAARERD